MKPWIGISGIFLESENRYFLPKDYVAAIENAGGIPVMLPWCHGEALTSRLSRLDGLLLPGGADVHPKHYGETCCPLTKPEELRDDMELQLYLSAFQKGLPILGICRGVQLMAVAGGGSLYQHIEGHGGGVFHSITFLEDRPAFAKHSELTVNSFHHQAVKKLPLGARVLARSHEGSIEAISFSDRFFCIGVQWHPERQKDESAKALFSALIDAARHA